MLPIVADVTLLLLMMAALYGYGVMLRVRVPLNFWNRAAGLAFTYGFGTALTATMLFAASLLGLYQPWLAWGLLISGLSLMVLYWEILAQDLQALWGLLRKALHMPWYVRVLLLLAVVWGLLNLLGGIAPPTEGDTVHQYLLLPRYWVEAGQYVQPTHIWAATLPGNAMLLSGWGLLLRPSFSTATLLVAFGASLMVAVALYALARLFFNQISSLLAVVFLYTMPDAAYLAQSGKVDMLWALFEILALTAFLRWFTLAGAAGNETREGWRWLLFAGLFAGLAAGTKVQAFISVLLLMLWLVVFSVVRGQFRRLAQRLALFLGLTATGGFPFYLYNLIVHRSPFYPVFAKQFALIGGLPSPRSELGTEVFYDWTVLGYVGNLIGMSIGHHPDLNFYLGFIVGPIFLMALVVGALLGVLKDKPIIRHMLMYAFVFSVMWFVVKQAARHFVPGLAFLSIVAGYVLWRVDQQHSAGKYVVQLASIAMVTVNLTLIIGVQYGNGTHRIALGMEREAYIAAWHNEVAPITFPTWETIQALDAYDGERILAEHANGSLYISPDLVSGNWGDRVDYANIQNTTALLRALEANGIDYILQTHIITGDKPLFAQNAFLEAYAEVVYRGERMTLYRIREVQ